MLTAVVVTFLGVIRRSSFWMTGTAKSAKPGYCVHLARVVAMLMGRGGDEKRWLSGNSPCQLSFVMGLP